MYRRQKQEGDWYTRRALSAAIAYWCAPMLQRCCDPKIWNTVRLFHVQGLPVPCAVCYTQTSYSHHRNATDSLKAQIEENVLHYQDMYQKRRALIRTVRSMI